MQLKKNVGDSVAALNVKVPQNNVINTDNVDSRTERVKGI